ncbi:MAG TPA: outer membrane protein assembly factor BamD [Myxococcota bacterium]|nr:outer membrane protein assembly factor BamD [Myxococcota bacterium]
MKNQLLTKIVRNSRSRSARALGSGAVLTIALLCGCATAPPEEEELPSAESYYQHGVESLAGKRTFLFFHDVDYAKAIEYFQEVIDNYPYSDFAILAELQIADIHFDRAEYEEASSYYHDFVELHPNHAKVSYALYRNGLCSYNQMRASDRDQAPTREAVAQFKALIERYPQSEMAADAAVRLHECEDRLARQDIDIADYYYSQRAWYAAARRYRAALKDFPEHDGRTRTLVQLGFCLSRLHQYLEAEAMLRRALELGAENQLREDAQGELEAIARQPVYGPRPLAKSCVTDPNAACTTTP